MLNQGMVLHLKKGYYIKTKLPSSLLSSALTHHFTCHCTRGRLISERKRLKYLYPILLYMHANTFHQEQRLSFKPTCLWPITLMPNPFWSHFFTPKRRRIKYSAISQSFRSRKSTTTLLDKRIYWGSLRCQFILVSGYYFFSVLLANS